MRKLKAMLISVLGLLFLAQGFAVAAADLNLTSNTQESAEMAPCHGDMQSGNPDKPSCCDADCPDMASCAFSHVAMPALVTVAIPPAAFQPVVASLSATPSTSTQSLLRPPISSHA